jgi:hypothetical protein
MKSVQRHCRDMGRTGKSTHGKSMSRISLTDRKSEVRVFRFARSSFYTALTWVALQKL